MEVSHLRLDKTTSLDVLELAFHATADDRLCHGRMSLDLRDICGARGARSVLEVILGGASDYGIYTMCVCSRYV